MSDTTVPVAPRGPPVLLTAEEFAARFAHVHAELVKGVVKEYPVPMPKHGFVCFRIALLVGTHVEQNDLGRVMTNDSWIKTRSNPDTVRGADVCFFSYERLPKGEVPEGLLSVVPELVFEVRSPSDRWPEILVKVGEYLQAGVRVVVVVDPPTSSATVYRHEELHHTFHNGDPLTLPDVLPDFSVPVSRLFA
ncbi:MAG: Uma2 family endonuclease [Gemmataceae bacterium]